MQKKFKNISKPRKSSSFENVILNPLFLQERGDFFELGDNKSQRAASSHASNVLTCFGPPRRLILTRH